MLSPWWYWKYLFSITTEEYCIHYIFHLSEELSGDDFGTLMQGKLEKFSGLNISKEIFSSPLNCIEGNKKDKSFGTFEENTSLIDEKIGKQDDNFTILDAKIGTLEEKIGKMKMFENKLDDKMDQILFAIRETVPRTSQF